MPHVIAKLYPGRTAEQKQMIADELTDTLIKVLNSKETLISVGIDDVKPAGWDAKVRQPDISAKPDTIYKYPGGVKARTLVQRRMFK